MLNMNQVCVQIGFDRKLEASYNPVVLDHYHPVIGFSRDLVLKLPTDAALVVGRSIQRFWLSVDLARDWIVGKN